MDTAVRADRRGDWRLIAAVALAIGAAAWASLSVDGELESVPTLAASLPASAATGCVPLPLSRSDGSLVTNASNVQLNANTYLVAHLCEPTLLSLVAAGSEVDGVGARLIISLGTDNLFDDDVTSSLDIEIVTDTPGWLLIAFGNDLYRPPADRNLHLQDIELTPLATATGNEP